MSATIDERIVSMRFDNKQFESNVQTSLGTLDRLKQSLNLSGASKGLENVSSAAKGVNMSLLGSGVEAVKVKFSALQVMATTALTRISNSAYTTGLSLAKAFTIDPIKTGLAEYETQIGAIQTILANTQSKGSTLGDVNSALDELNTYADKTIYNFTEMTRNIGTFTAAGVDLDKSVTSIKGIANLAAVSGSTSQQASTAMYQLSQALASGTVRLADWNSVVNAGMGGELFQNALKRTAKQMGHNVDEMIEKYGSFRESLTQGEWLTADVLTETLTQLSGAYSEADLIAQGYSEKQAKEIVELSQTAVDAATKVKTFTQLMDTLKESAQSGWTQTWELLVGDFEQAKELWTSVSDVFGGFINDSAEARNTLLEGALTSNWDKLIKTINGAGVETSEFQKRVSEVAKDHGYNLDSLIKNYGSLEEVFRSGALPINILKEATNGYTKSLADLSKVQDTVKKGKTGEDVKQVQEALKSLGYDLGKYGADGKYGKITENAVKAFQKAQGLKITGVVDEETLAALKEATTETHELIAGVDEFINNLDKLGGRQLLIESFKNLFAGLMSVLKPIGEAFRDIFPPMTADQLYNAIESFKNLTEKLKLSDENAAKLKSAFKGLFSVVDIGWTFIKDLAGGLAKLIGSVVGLGGGILSAAGSLGDWITNLRDSIKEGDYFGKAVDKIVGFLQNGIEKIKQFGNFLKGKFSAPGFEGFLGVMQSIWNIIQKVGGKVGEIASSIGKALSGALRSDNLASGVDVLNGGIFGLILWNIKDFVGGLSDAVDGAGGFLEGIKDTLDSVKGCLESWQQDVKAGALLKIAGALAILAASLWLIASIDPGKLAGALISVGTLFAELMGTMSTFSSLELNTKGMMTTAAAMIGMSAAVLILAGAMKVISSLSWGEIARGLGSIIVLLGALVLVAKAMATDGNTFVQGAGQMLVMAGAMVILAGALKIVSSLSWEQLAVGLSGLVVLMGALVLAAKAMTTNGSKFVQGAGQMLVMAGALVILAGALKIIGSMKLESLVTGLVGLAGGMIVLVGGLNAMKGTAGGAASLLIASAALVVLAGALKIIGSMEFESLVRGLTTLGLAMIILVAGLNAMTGTIAGAGALLVAAGALAILTPVLMTLGSMSWGSIAKGLVAIAGAFAVLGIAGAVLGPMIPAILGLAGALALIGAATLAFGAGVAALAFAFGTLVTMTATGAAAIVSSLTIIVTGIAALIPTILKEFGNGIVAFCEVIGGSATAIAKAVKDVVLALVDVLVECIPAIADGALKLVAGLLASLATYTPQIVDSLIDFLIGVLDGLSARMPELIQAAMGALTSFFTELTAVVFDMDFSTLAKAAIGVGLFAGLLAVLGFIAPLIPSAMLGILGIGAVIAELALLMAAFGALSAIPGLTWLVEKGGDLLQSVGQAIGKFLGGIVGGFGGGVLTSFLDTISGLSEEDANKIAAFATVLSSLADVAAKVPKTGGLTQAITGTPDLIAFSDGLLSLGTSIKTFSDSVSEIPAEATSKMLVISGVIDTLISVASKVPATGGLAQAITGTPDLVTFSGGLTSLGVAIASFASSVTDISVDAVTKMTAISSVIDALVSVAAKVPETGGLSQAITGTPDLISFSNGLIGLGGAISSFSGSVTDISLDSIVKMMALIPVIGSLVTIADLIPESGGLAQAISGAPDLAKFAGEMTTFGLAVATFSSSVTEVSPDDVTKMSQIGEAAKTLVSVATSLGEYNDSTWFNTSLTEFAKELGKFGTAMSTFSGSVVAVDTSKLYSISSVARSFIGLATSMNGVDVEILSTFGSKLSSLGWNLENFYDSISEMDTGKLSSVAKALSSLSNINADGADNLQTFINSLGNIGTQGVDKFVSAFSNSSTKVLSATAKMMSTLVKGVTSKIATVAASFRKVGIAGANAFRSTNGSFQSAGKYITDGLARGISSGQSTVVAACVAVAKAALLALKAALGIKSPSREAYALGDFTGQGFVNALYDYESKTYNAARGIGESAKSGLSKAISKVSDIMNADIDAQPVIRPILDLSDVANGAGSINGMFNMQPSIGVMSSLSAINGMMNRRQNGSNSDVISAIKDLGSQLGNTSGNNYYSIGDISYDDGSAIADAIGTLVRAATVERRV